MVQNTRILQKVFTKEQLIEQEDFKTDLENGTANIVFEGTFEEGISFLKETGKLVDTCINP